MREGASIILWLSEQGAFEKLESLVRINRTGYAGIDVFITLVLYFAAGQPGGIRAFCARVRRWQPQLAALAGKRRLPSQASVSRALSSAETSLIRPGALELLTTLIDVKEMLGWAACHTWDTGGERYQVFDFDYTSEGVNERPLPADDDLPAAKRRGARYAAPGHLGNKRGDAKRTRTSLQHAGTGLWLGGHVGKGNGSPRSDFEAGVATAKAFCDEQQWPTNRAIIRGDGAFGSVPNLTACIESEICLVSRCQRYDLFEQADVQKRIMDALWFEVPSSRTAPQRYAAELGMATLPASEKTYRDDGTRFEPVEVRLVVSRIKLADDATEAKRGRLIDGWQYELFVSVGLDPKAFPAAELVSMYFQRNGQENRFAQEDRELQLGRLFSENPAGQELALLAGQFVWNFRIARGVELARESDVQPEQPLRNIREAPACAALSEAPNPNSATSTPGGGGKAEGPDVVRRIEDEIGKQNAEIHQWLSRIDWEKALRRRKNWHWNGSVLICPAGELMRYQGASLDRDGPTVRLCAPSGVCGTCDHRLGCTSSIAANPVKMIHIKTESKIVEELQGAGRPRLRESLREKSSASAKLRKHRKRKQPLAFEPHCDEVGPGPFAVFWPLFLPAEARKLWQRQADDFDFKISTFEPSHSTTRSKLLAADDADRQRRRRTWEQRQRWNQLRDDTRVSIELRTTTGQPPPWLADSASTTAT